MNTNTNQYVTNPLTGRIIRMGGPTFCRLLYHDCDFINGELIQRNNTPPIQEARYLNTETNRLITFGSRRYHQLIHAGWEIENDYYLTPPWRSAEVHARALADIVAPEPARRIPMTYEQLMDKHRNSLIELNITLCRECLHPIKIEEGEYCEQCIGQVTAN
jgi:hypothetical protein